MSPAEAKKGDSPARIFSSRSCEHGAYSWLENSYATYAATWRTPFVWNTRPQKLNLAAI